jgi:hypothetical protein
LYVRNRNVPTLECRYVAEERLTVAAPVGVEVAERD